MKHLILALVLIVSSFRAVAPVIATVSLNPVTHCGTERWHIKTLDDPGVNHIEQVAKSATIAALRALPIPGGYSRTNDASRYAPPEQTKFTVTAAVMGFKEEADRDLHVVIADPDTGQTMIAEIPDPNCSTVQQSGHANKIAAVRSSFIVCFGQPHAGSGFKHLDATALLRLTGVGFFDYVHAPAQIGVAPNGFELHPLLSMKKTGGKCPQEERPHP